MSDPVFVGELAEPLPAIGTAVLLDGAEGRHAATVRRIRIGERVVISDGNGRGVGGPVVDTAKDSITVEVAETMISPEPALQITVAQALAKGDRSDLACEMITELGASMIIPWQASRSIVRWTGDRGAKSRAKWQSTVREATKQSRRLRIPYVTEPATSKQLPAWIDDHDLALVLHEEATTPLREIALPERGRIMIIVGPEGGIADDELAAFTAAGAHPITISDGVLRTSTAAAAAISGILVR